MEDSIFVVFLVPGALLALGTFALLVGRRLRRQREQREAVALRNYVQATRAPWVRL